MVTPALSDRTRRILATLVRSYIETGEPVASAALAQQAGLNVSSATVRNVMAQLEEMGYVWQPHTSAGRVPTDTGYRCYVDMLIESRRPTKDVSAVELRLRQEAGLRVESALGAEKRAREALEEAVKRAATTTAGGDADDQAQAIRAAELCLHAEQALRHDAEAKVARCMLQRRADQARLVQLKSELREADARAEEMSSQMRGGPFAGF